MFCSRNTRTACWSMPASIAATSAPLSGPWQSTPATSPTNTGCSGRIETGIAVSFRTIVLVIVACGPHHISTDGRKIRRKKIVSVKHLTRLSRQAPHFLADIGLGGGGSGVEDDHVGTRSLAAERDAGRD